MGPPTRVDVGDSARRQHLAAAFVGQASKRASNVRGVGAKKLLRREVAEPKIFNQEDLCIVDRLSHHHQILVLGIGTDRDSHASHIHFEIFCITKPGEHQHSFSPDPAAWRRHPCGHLPRGIISDASRGGRQSTLEMRNDSHCRSRLLRARGLTDLGLAVNLSCKCARKDVPTFPPILSIDYPQFIRTSTIGESKWLTSLAAVVLSGGEGNYEFVEVRSSPRTLLCFVTPRKSDDFSVCPSLPLQHREQEAICRLRDISPIRNVKIITCMESRVMMSRDA